MGKTRQPLINDLHVGTLYSDLKESERKYKALKVEYNRENIARLRSDLRIAIKDANEAYDSLDTMPEFLQEKGRFADQAIQIKNLLGKVRILTATQQKAQHEAANAAVIARASGLPVTPALSRSSS